EYTGEGKLERSANFTTKIACVVTDVTPSGLLHIEGERHLTINGETQVIALSGFVRPEDVRIDNTLPSELVASADIRYGGVGVVSEEQRMPWLTRLMRLALPF
ncbi:MAG: flagellar basal body L-ring protein FlgH, partial [bacterium]|nr:flagellar basal body L-ring protein FlgH [bacterium]